jgi:predicted enzyme related to lactoylglutathione lyase
MKIEAILLHSAAFVDLADFYRRAFDLPEPTPMGDSHVGWPTTPYLGFDTDPYSPISIWFKVDDVPATIEKLVAAGSTRLTPPDDSESPGEIIARVRDPAGNVVGLVADA